MTVVRAGVGPNGADLLERKAKLLRGHGGVALVLLVTTALPGNQHAALAQQRSRVLGEHRERRQRAGGDEVARPEAGAPRLGAIRYDVDVGQPCGVGRGTNEGALSGDTLYESDLRRSQRHGERQARKACAGAQIGDRPCGAHVGKLECDKRIGEVGEDCLLWHADGRWRVRIARERLQKRLKRRRGLRQTEPIDKSLYSDFGFHVKQTRVLRFT
jgi:hypothetical protein